MATMKNGEGKRKPLTDKEVFYDPKAYNCDAKHIYEMTVKALKESGLEDKIEEYERFISYGDHRHLIQVSKQYVKLVRMETKTPPRRRSGGGASRDASAGEAAKRKFKVSLSIRLRGDFNILAPDESKAEDILLKCFKDGKVKIRDLKSGGETSVFCVREIVNGKVDFPNDDDEGEEPPKYICPMSQQPCDEDCSWDEKANCEYYQGLVAGRAERGK